MKLRPGDEGSDGAGVLVAGAFGARRGRELAATVVVPPTTPAALETLGRYWDTGTLSATVSLDAVSYPPLDALGSPQASGPRVVPSRR